MTPKAAEGQRDGKYSRDIQKCGERSKMAKMTPRKGKRTDRAAGQLCKGSRKKVKCRPVSRMNIVIKPT